MSDPVASGPAEDAARFAAEAGAAAPHGFLAYDVSYALACEAVDAWARFWSLWFDAAAQIAVAAGATAWIDVATRSACAPLEACDRAVAERLARGGVAQPLLNDP